MSDGNSLAPVLKSSRLLLSLPRVLRSSFSRRYGAQGKQSDELVAKIPTTTHDSPKSLHISTTEISRRFSKLPEVLQAYISLHAGALGMLPHEILLKIPPSFHGNPVKIYRFLRFNCDAESTAVKECRKPVLLHNQTISEDLVGFSLKDDPLCLEKYLDAQLNSTPSAKSNVFGAPSTLVVHSESFAEAFGLNNKKPLDMDEYIQILSDPIFSNANSGVDVHPCDCVTDANTQFWTCLGDPLADIGISLKYSSMRGFGGVLHFLRSISWKKFQRDGRYRQATLARTLRTFRSNSWNPVAKAVIIGFIIASFPPLSFFFISLGMTGLAAMGIRILACKSCKPSGPVALILGKIADILAESNIFLMQVFGSFGKIIDVVIEPAASTAKRIVKAGDKFVDLVNKTSVEVVKISLGTAAAASQDAHKVVDQLASRMSGWIYSWFCIPECL